jgi:hypothetical protein
VRVVEHQREHAAVVQRDAQAAGLVAAAEDEMPVSLGWRDQPGFCDVVVAARDAQIGEGVGIAGAAQLGGDRCRHDQQGEPEHEAER